jgi:hypothetical protein
VPTTLNIDQGVGSVLGETSVEVTPDETTTYTLTASNSGGSATPAQIEVTVTPLPEAPVISTFNATPSTSAGPGSPVTLDWTLEGGTPTSLTIDQGVGSVLGSSSVGVSPTATTTYALTASNISGVDTETTTVTVPEPETPPTITSFTADPTTIELGDSSELSWTVEGTEPVTARILADGSEIFTGSGSGSQLVTPSATTIYTLEAENGVGTDTSDPVTVTVTPNSL